MGEGSGPVPASPIPLGSGAKYKKRITNTEWGGDSINRGQQGQTLLTVSHLHPEFSKIQIVKVYDPSGLLTKIKSHVPNKPKVRRQLDDQGQPERRQVDMVRETKAEKRQGERHSGKRQPETARNNQRGWNSQKKHTAGDSWTETGCLQISRSSVSNSRAWLWGPK